MKYDHSVGIAVFGPAQKNVWDRRNLTSLQAVWEGRKWIGKV
jgi:hypothetical protein